MEPLPCTGLVQVSLVVRLLISLLLVFQFPKEKNFALDPLPLTLFHLFYLSLPAKVKVGISPRMNVTKHLVQTSDYIPSSELIITCHSFLPHLWHFPLSDLLG